MDRISRQRKKLSVGTNPAFKFVTLRELRTVRNTAASPQLTQVHSNLAKHRDTVLDQHKRGGQAL